MMMIPQNRRHSQRGVFSGMETIKLYLLQQVAIGWLGNKAFNMSETRITSTRDPVLS